jgi:hypothetical protein
LNDQFKDDELGRACRTHGDVEEFVWNFGGKARRKTPLGSRDVGWRIILIWISEKYSRAGWIELIWLRIGTREWFL